MFNLATYKRSSSRSPRSSTLLPRTLITPIDGDDIQRLVSSVDDALDAVYAVAQRLFIYRVDEVRKPARRLAH